MAGFIELSNATKKSFEIYNLKCNIERTGFTKLTTTPRDKELIVESLYTQCGLVYCKDCKYFNTINCAMKRDKADEISNSASLYEKSYCSFGERR